MSQRHFIPHIRYYYHRTITLDISPYTPTPNQNENAKTTAPSNFDAEAFGDMFSTLYNRI